MSLLYLYGKESDYMEFVLKENKRFLETYLLQARIVGGDGVIHHFEFQNPQGRQLYEKGQ